MPNPDGSPTPEELEAQKRIIGLPIGKSNTPAMLLPVSPAPMSESLGIPQGMGIPPMISTPPAKPQLSPLGQQQQTDQQRLQQEQGWQFGSKIANPWGRGALRGLDIVGTALAPRIAAAIPGSTVHHNLELAKDRAAVAGDIAEQEKEAQASDLNARPQMQQAAMEHQNQLEAQKETARQAQQTQAQKEQQDRLDEQLQQQEDRAEQHETEAEQRQAKQFAEQEKLANIREGKKGEEKGVLAEVPDGKGGFVLQRILPGESIPSGARTATQAGATTMANEKSLAGGQKAIEYAKDYLDNGIYTGPGDEALMDQFFSLAKPDSGFRMSTPQLNMMRQGRSWMQGVEAHIRHATVGTWFSDEQRKQIVDAMTHLEKATQAAHGQQPEQPTSQQGGKVQNWKRVNGKLVPE